MLKTKEELNELKQEYDSLVNKLKELTEDELLQVTGGLQTDSDIDIELANPFAP